MGTGPGHTTGSKSTVGVYAQTPQLRDPASRSGWFDISDCVQQDKEETDSAVTPSSSVVVTTWSLSFEGGPMRPASRWTSSRHIQSTSLQLLILPPDCVCTGRTFRFNKSCWAIPVVWLLRRGSFYAGLFLPHLVQSIHAVVARAGRSRALDHSSSRWAESRH